MKHKIRDAGIADLNVVQKLSRKLSVKEEEEFDSTIDPSWSTSEDAEDYFKDRIQGKDGYAIVAEYKEEVIGYLIGGLHEAEDFRDTETIAEAETMYIEPDYRGKGLGTRMFENFLEWTKETDAERARVEASAGNDMAINFYRSHDFEDYALSLEREI